MRDGLTAWLILGKASQVALSRARSRYGWSFGPIWMREARGVSSCEYVREKKINKEQGRSRCGRNWVPEALHVVVILGRSKMADHV